MTRSRQRRTLILDAAERLFAERGFDATPTAAIADLAGVPKGLVFYYFPGKTDLLRALVAERLDLDPVDTSALIAPGDPAQTLLNVTERFRELQEESAVRRVIVWREHRTHPEVRAKLHDYRRQLQSVVERVLGASILHPIAAYRVRVAAAAWVAIITTPSLPDHLGADEPDAAEPADGLSDPEDGADLPALADLISAGLRETAA
jgi:AcrR family transcriptional regulator